jgi:hypothetical protein
MDCNVAWQDRIEKTTVQEARNNNLIPEPSELLIAQLFSNGQLSQLMITIDNLVVSKGLFSPSYGS